MTVVLIFASWPVVTLLAVLAVGAVARVADTADAKCHTAQAFEDRRRFNEIVAAEEWTA